MERYGHQSPTPESRGAAEAWIKDPHGDALSEVFGGQVGAMEFWVTNMAESSNADDRVLATHFIPELSRFNRSRADDALIILATDDDPRVSDALDRAISKILDIR